MVLGVLIMGNEDAAAWVDYYRGRGKKPSGTPPVAPCRPPSSYYGGILHYLNNHSLSAQYHKHKEPEIEPDLINKAPHYTKSNIEPIEFIEGLGIGEEFCIGNVIKYVSRYKHKNGLEDLKKAQWYIERVIGKLEESNNDLES